MKNTPELKAVLHDSNSDQLSALYIMIGKPRFVEVGTGNSSLVNTDKDAV